MVALLSVASLGYVEQIGFQIKRDREDELIHRGTEYARAIRRFVKQFGRYPESIRELESTNNMRFLRKRYKDPITGEDFEVVRADDVHPNLHSQTGVNGSEIARVQRVAADQGVEAAPGDSDPAVDPASDPPSPAESTASASQDSVTIGNSVAGSQNSSAKPSETTATSMMAGGPIVGVTSRSKQKSIREFDRKDHYNQWRFVYNPATDNGALITGPNQQLYKAAGQETNELVSNTGQANPPASEAQNANRQ